VLHAVQNCLQRVKREVKHAGILRSVALAHQVSAGELVGEGESGSRRPSLKPRFTPAAKSIHNAHVTSRSTSLKILRHRHACVLTCDVPAVSFIA